jgi:hypothetical protein
MLESLPDDGNSPSLLSGIVAAAVAVPDIVAMEVSVHNRVLFPQPRYHHLLQPSLFLLLPLNNNTTSAVLPRLSKVFPPRLLSVSLSRAESLSKRARQRFSIRFLRHSKCQPRE